MSAGDEALPAAGHAGRRALTRTVLPVSTSFALALYRRLAAERGGNLFLSPQSISAAMALALAGARGETAAEIERVLQLPAGTVADESAYELVSANAMWAALELDLLPEYAAKAALQRLDFAHDTEGARRRINAWVDEATRHKIPELLGPESMTSDMLLVLTNAIYMKAPWLHPFPPHATRSDALFHTPAGEQRVAMMAQTATFRFLRGDGLRVLELPYRGEDTSMLIVLPNAIDGLAAIDRSLSVETLQRWRARLQRTTVDVRVPRFSLESEFELSATLQEMGIRRAFGATGPADFSGIARSPLMISRVIHQAVLDVTEEGTEAAAATAVTLLRAGMPREYETFNADHPFFFAILRRDNVLFCGRFIAPAV